MINHKAKVFLHVGASVNNLGKTMVSGSNLGVGTNWVTISEIDVEFPIAGINAQITAAKFLSREMNRKKNEQADELVAMSDSISGLVDYHVKSPKCE